MFLSITYRPITTSPAAWTAATRIHRKARQAHSAGSLHDCARAPPQPEAGRKNVVLRHMATQHRRSCAKIHTSLTRQKQHECHYNQHKERLAIATLVSVWTCRPTTGPDNSLSAKLPMYSSKCNTPPQPQPKQLCREVNILHACTYNTRDDSLTSVPKANST